MARQAPVGDRLSGQGFPDSGEAPMTSLIMRSLSTVTWPRGRASLCGLLALVVVAFAPQLASATKIESIKSPAGIEFWLVRDPTVPLIAINFGFRGGSAQEPADKGGAMNMMGSLLDEGAGEVDAKAFQERLERGAIEMTFTAGRDTFRGSLRTLKENQDEAFELLRLAERAALCARGGRAHPRTDRFAPATAVDEPERNRHQHMVGARLPGPS